MKHIIDTLWHIKSGVQVDNSSNELIDESENNEKSRSQSFVSSKGTNIIEEENNEKIEVGWDIYYKFFILNKNFIIHLLWVPLFVGYSTSNNI